MRMMSTLTSCRIFEGLAADASCAGQYQVLCSLCMEFFVRMVVFLKRSIQQFTFAQDSEVHSHGGEFTPWPSAGCRAYCQTMKHSRYSKHQSPKPTNDTGIPARDSNLGETPFLPSRDEISRKAYFNFVNQGSQPGHDEQHWLEAEATLRAEIVHGSRRHSGSQSI